MNRLLRPISGQTPSERTITCCCRCQKSYALYSTNPSHAIYHIHIYAIAIGTSHRPTQHTHPITPTGSDGPSSTQRDHGKLVHSQSSQSLEPIPITMTQKPLPSSALGRTHRIQIAALRLLANLLTKDDKIRKAMRIRRG
ncbi:uncharacterized protein BDZ99DRAFT_3349 [Mytilinidion resinicola]|uniref:Uncharacterized protein n=1 Tax=Mytilinidion resinicola TaxID=574789 RepID=A0A6A6Z752_9PEZI|nr:uncharacterized protein BDZ99DRAFT_3349 [Mytilinidion resinicola]KAF2816860.1 hypothetical protein BDZ99DRAFT_3349 [Mytilinidion resinicola]